MVTTGKKTCEMCKRLFPTHLLKSLVSEGVYLVNVCPLCGLAHIRKTHGIPDWEFQLEHNVLRYEEALKVIKNGTKSIKNNTDTGKTTG